MPAQMHQHVTDEMRRCAQECQRCHEICMETIYHCLHMGGKHADPHHIRLLADCVQICQTSADFMRRGSDLHGHTCRACSVISDRCAQDCADMSEDPQMETCADQCRRCAESCRKMTA